MPLSKTHIGDEARIVRITEEGDVRQHLEHLGFVPGETVTVVSQIANNLILSIKNTRIALDKSLVEKIIVQH